MKKLLTITLLLMFGASAFAQIDIVKRKVTLDSLDGRSDTIWTSGHFIPQDSAEWNIGSAEKPYNIIYADSITANNVEGATYPDSSVLFTGSDGKPTTDSSNFRWNNDWKALVIGGGDVDFSGGLPFNGVALWPNQDDPTGYSFSLNKHYSTSDPYVSFSQNNTAFSYGGNFVGVDSFSPVNIVFSGVAGIGATEDGSVTKGNRTGVFAGNYTGTVIASGIKVLTGVGLCAGCSMNISATSEIRALNIEGTFTRTGGNPLWTGINISPTLSMTVGSGVKRGVYVNTQISGAISNYRGIEVTNNTGHQLYMSGQAPNYIRSATGIGVITPLDTLHVAGTARVTTTPASTNGTDSVLVKDGSTGQIKAVTQPLTDTATLDFASINASSTGDATMTVTGAVVTDPVIVGFGAELQGANINVTAFVSSANTVTVRVSNIGAIPFDADPCLIKVKVFK